MAVRENISNYGIVREYKNGNITVKLDVSYIDNNCSSDYFFASSECLSWVDTYYIEEVMDTFARYLLYNPRLNKVYRMYESDVMLLEDGKTIRLVAADPDENEREILDNNGWKL